MEIYRGALNGSPDDLNVTLHVLGKRNESSDCLAAAASHSSRPSMGVR